MLHGYIDRDNGQAVRAGVIDSVTPLPTGGAVLTFQPGPAEATVRADWYANASPVAGGYFVVTPDGGAFMTPESFVLRFRPE